jgi:hypothetical protein
MELWHGIPVIITCTSIEGEINTYHVNVKVAEWAKIHKDQVYFEGNYTVKAKGGYL